VRAKCAAGVGRGARAPEGRRGPAEHRWQAAPSHRRMRIMERFSAPSPRPSPALDRSLPVLVVRVGHSPLLDHGAVGAVRSLGRLGVPVHALIEDRSAPIGYSRYLAGSFVWPVTGGEDPSLLVSRLRRICARLDRLPAVALPTSDEAAVLLAE